MKEILFKMRKNYEQNRKFCVVKVETLKYFQIECREYNVARFARSNNVKFSWKKYNRVWQKNIFKSIALFGLKITN